MALKIGRSKKNCKWFVYGREKST